MKIQCYRQHEGFSEVEFPIEWEDGDGVESWLERGDFDTGDPDSMDGSSLSGLTVWGRRYKKDVAHDFQYMAIISDRVMYHEVVLEDMSSLLAFRMAAANLLLSNSIGERMDKIDNHRESCNICNPVPTGKQPAKSDNN